MKTIVYAITAYLLCSVFSVAASAENRHDQKHKQAHEQNREECCLNRNGQCEPQQRGRCGKKKGDCYGMRQPVKSAQEARQRFQDYFAEQKVLLSVITEKPLRFEAELKDTNGRIVDKVMIDKRSGRIRSQY